MENFYPNSMTRKQIKAEGKWIFSFLSCPLFSIKKRRGKRNGNQITRCSTFFFSPPLALLVVQLKWKEKNKYRWKNHSPKKKNREIKGKHFVELDASNIFHLFTYCCVYLGWLWVEKLLLLIPSFIPSLLSCVNLFFIFSHSSGVYMCGGKSSENDTKFSFHSASYDVFISIGKILETSFISSKLLKWNPFCGKKIKKRMIKTEQQLLKVNIILCRLVYIAKKRHLNEDKNHAAILIPFVL